MYLANTSTFQDMPYSMSMIFLLRDIQQGTQAQALINRAIIYYLDLLPVDRVSPLGEVVTPTVNNSTPSLHGQDGRSITIEEVSHIDSPVNSTHSN